MYSRASFGGAQRSGSDSPPTALAALFRKASVLAATAPDAACGSGPSRDFYLSAAAAALKAAHGGAVVVLGG